MLPDASMNGWHSTDDEQAVPVRSSQPAAPAAQPIDMVREPAPHLVLAHPAAPSASNMKLSAFLGIGVVLVGIGFYFGFGNLLGDLTGNATVVDIVITADGEFSPEIVEATPGETITITNENPDPQVIKTKNGRELFDVQVIFDEPFTFTVPADANGAYVYFSETLPEDKTLTINVVTSQAAVEVSSADIPLPFGDNTVTLDPPASVSSSSSSSVASSAAPVVRVEPTEHSSDPADITIGAIQPSSSSSSSSSTSGAIPTNPYTVGNRETRTAEIAAAARQNLHSGAPVNEIRQHRPKAVTETGPAGTLALMLLPPLLAVGMLYRKLGKII